MRKYNFLNPFSEDFLLFSTIWRIAEGSPDGPAAAVAVGIQNRKNKKKIAIIWAK